MCIRDSPSTLHFPLSAARRPFQFKLKSDLFSLAFAFLPPMVSLVIYYLTQSPSFIWMRTVSEHGRYEKKIFGSTPETNLPLLNPPPSCIVILLRSWASAPEGQPVSTDLTNKPSRPIHFSGGTQWKINSSPQISFSLWERCFPAGSRLDEIPYIIPDVIRCMENTGWLVKLVQWPTFYSSVNVHH